LHLAYILARLGEGDEVIAPVFTCVATNIPLLYSGAVITFADIQPDTLNIDPDHVRQLASEKTRAIICTHYGGLPCDLKELRDIADTWGIPLIDDAAQALGATYQGEYIGAHSDYTAFSFQAVKHITTGDGGMLLVKDEELAQKAKKTRWFGINRSARLQGFWDNQISEIGYKYQMTDIAAAMGLAALESFDLSLAKRRRLLAEYNKNLQRVPGVRVLGSKFTDREHAAWLCTVLVENRQNLQQKLSEHHIESDLVHYRNDRYSVFNKQQHGFPNMDKADPFYLVLPMHPLMSIGDVQEICHVIASGW
jgi:dTDP-4-amino-4,6-dideoxygalactose transaminase